MSDPNAPSWLSDDVGTTGVPADTLDAVPVSADSSAGTVNVNSSATNASQLEQDAADEAALPGIILSMRLANMGAAVSLMTCSILLLTQIPSISNFVLAIYATCGGLLVCCLETQLKFIRVGIAVNFGFLFNSGWRFMYHLLLASVAWAYGTLFGQIVAGILIGVAVFNTYVLCRYPSYRKIREKAAEEEDKRIQDKITSQVQKQAISSVTGGGSKI